MKRQVELLRQQLTASQQQNHEFEVTVTDLRSQLDETAKQLAQAKVTGANPEETARLTKENEMLRQIVMRERQQDARRDQARKLMLAEFEKLQIKSDTLNQQIELLAQPVTKLSTEELALFRQPMVVTSDSGTAPAVTGSFAAAKEPQEGANRPGPNVVTTFQPAVPEELIPIALRCAGDLRGELLAAGTGGTGEIPRGSFPPAEWLNAAHPAAAGARRGAAGTHRRGTQSGRGTGRKEDYLHSSGSDGAPALVRLAWQPAGAEPHRPHDGIVLRWEGDLPGTCDFLAGSRSYGPGIEHCHWCAGRRRRRWDAARSVAGGRCSQACGVCL